MQVIFERCAGLDVHKKTVVACRVRATAAGQAVREKRTFGTTTAELLQMLDWLVEWDCTHVAMESTGEFWKPVYNVLEGNLEVWLVNAQHAKAVPGRKTDVGDAEWLSDLMRHGLVRPSFIPPRPQRDLRDLTRTRCSLVRERASVVNRVQKVLEGANIKLSSVASDVLGLSGRAMLEALVAGQADPALLANLARGKLRSKLPQLEQALVGRVREHHRFLLAHHLAHIDFLDEQIDSFSQEIHARLETALPPLPPADSPTPPTPPTTPSTDAPDAPPSAASSAPPPLPPLTWSQAVTLVDTSPGFDVRSAQNILAEIGIDMKRFFDADHLASWAGVAPGNNESGGKHRSGRTPPGDRPVRRILLQAAWTATRTKGSYLSALYHRLALRRGKKRAILAVAHSLIVSLYHMLTRQKPYRDLGANYFDERKRESVTNNLVRRLEKLGYQVKLETKPAAT